MKIFQFFKKIIVSDFGMALLLFSVSFLLYSHFADPDIGGDAISMYYPARQFMKLHSFDSWSPLNYTYNTYYFKMTFMDTSIKKWGNSFPTQTQGAILISTLFMLIAGDTGFVMMAAFFGAATVSFVYLIVKLLTGHTSASALAALILISMPVFFLWSTVTQNISVASCFLIFSVYAMVKKLKSGNNLWLVVSGLFFGLSGWVRIPHFLLTPAFAVFFLQKKLPLPFRWKQIAIFSFPVILLTYVMLVFNRFSFNDPFFIGYLRSNYHPNPPGYSAPELKIAQQYLLSGFSLSSVFQSIVLFFRGSSIIYFILFPLSVLGLLIKTDNTGNKIKLFAVTAFSICITYYGYLEQNLWKDARPEYVFNLALAFFRYLLPVYVVSLIIMSFVLSHLLKTGGAVIKLSIIFLLVVYSFCYINVTYAYDGGANLAYFEDSARQIREYGVRINGVLQKHAIILYDDRRPLSYTYPHTLEYEWFYYDGVPPDIRQEHTRDITGKLLADRRTVYFLHSDPPYDTLSKDVESDLRQHFTFTPVDNTEFPRMKVQFFRVTLP